MYERWQVMTTYEEISTSKRLNRIFWNCELKFYIARRRESLKLKIEPNFINVIRSILNKRSTFEYFDN